MTRPLPPLTDEELTRWRAAPDPYADSGFGALETARGCLPLQSLDVRARIDGLFAGVSVTQTFVNVHAEPLEATYVFPLPDRAAVTRFRLEVAGRVVEGRLKERAAARRDYDRALREGRRAAITEEERPGVFTLRVGNLPPGERATVRLDLAGLLPYGEGEATFRFPLVVAPRYVPGVPLPGDPVGDGVAPDTDAAPDASRISPPVLLPGFPNPVRLSLAVEVPASPLAPSAFRSSLHAVVYEENGGGRRIRLEPGERLDRDFILRFRLAEDRVRTSLALQPEAEGDEGTFALTLVPPVDCGSKEDSAVSRDVVFVLDRSGSMEGWKMVAARRALARMVDTLADRDRFTVLAFDDSVRTPPGFAAGTLAAATDRNRFRAVEFLAGLGAGGGTEMARPLEQALGLLAGAGGDRILVLVTDGQVANEDEILRRLGPKVKGVRVFTLGIDRAVNAGFLRRLADLGGGISELVESEDRLDEVMDKVHRHIGKPVLTGLRLGPAGFSFVPGSLVPGRLPDLFAGAPLVVLGRYRGRHSGSLTLQAQDAAGRGWFAEVSARTEAAAPIAAVWARGRLRDLEDQYAVGGGDAALVEQEIVATSLRFGVLCRFTAFVAVDPAEVVNPGGEVHSIVQPVEQPSGWARLEHQIRPSLGTPAYMAPQPAAPPPSEATYFGDFIEDEAEDLDFLDARPATRARRTRGPVPPRPSAQLGTSSYGHQPGLIQCMLGLFSRRKKGRASGPPATGFDREPYRSRVAGLLQSLQACPSADAASRLGVLRSLFAEFELLFKDLVTAGDRDPSVQRLGQALLRIQALAAQPAPPDDAVQEVWRETEAVLEAWLAAAGPAAPPRTDGFWK